MIGKSKEVSFGSGQYLFRQGDKDQNLYIITDGCVEILVRDPKTLKDIPVETFPENSVLGILTFLLGESRSASAKAMCDTKCMVINQHQRDQLLSEIPDWAKILIKQMGTDLRSIDHKYLDLLNKNKALEAKLARLESKEQSPKEDKE